MTKTHFFYALTLPDETKELLQQTSERIKTEFPFKKWLHHDDYHITLAFLGDAPEEMRQKSLELVNVALAEVSKFELYLNGMGIFGDLASPRILWAGVDPSEQLFNLQKKVYTACEEAGFTLDKKPFKPHITLARKFIGNAFQLNRMQELADISNRTYRFQGATVTLYQTHLGQAPSYQPIATSSLI
ncbi:RNA 2',3'-cyclic phosphodiesterase [Bacillus cihuensis]|uniref:RNA 2',3'-cyclic phosphodiesterase n=1 Tax=Bacillus cihuensis TaxID=1208599 RepID=UPI00040001B0|nr:RNA 2',3'-cyclic phosphodiesterase [Bacillus cihuensis]